MFHEGAYAWFTSLPGPLQRIALAAVVLVMGWPVVRIVKASATRALGRAELDPTLRAFVCTLVAGTCWVVLVVVVLGVAGVDLVALMGGIAIGGFVVGFAIKDTLGNLAAGLLLLFHRPYKVGELVEVGGNKGRVLELGVALTRIREGDGRIITIPNGVILGSAIINHTREATRELEVSVRVGYDADLDRAFRVLLEAARSHPKVLPAPAPTVEVSLLDADAVVLQLKAWTKADELGGTRAAVRRRVVEGLQAAGVDVQAPRRDVVLVGGQGNEH